MNRTVTWNNQGVDVRGFSKVDDVLKNADLDYNVISRPLEYKVGEKSFIVPDRVVNIREDNPNKVYGVVSKTYEICQNQTAFDFINYIDEDIKFLKAGETRNGIIYIISELPEINVLGDKVKPNLIFQNGHNGLTSIKANICMLRVVCQNQFSYAFKNAENSINIRHSATLNERILQARETLKQTNEYLKAYVSNAESLAQKRITDKDLQKIIKEMVLKNKERDELNDKQNLRLAAFNNAYDSDDNQNFKGTAWGVINAFSDFTTHMIPLKKVSKEYEERRFINNTFANRDLNKLMGIIENVA